MSVGDAAVFLIGIRDTGSLAARTLNMPTRVVFDEFHLCSLSPPAIDLTGSRNPNAFLAPQICQVRQQSPVNSLFPRAANVIRMHNKTDQTVLLHYQIDLLLPQIDRIVIENVEQCIVLRGRHGHSRTTTASDIGPRLEIRRRKSAPYKY